MQRFPIIGSLLFIFTMLSGGQTAAKPVHVEVSKLPDGSYTLLRDGKPYRVKGAGVVAPILPHWLHTVLTLFERGQ
ncbi:hypothetical protein KUL118_66270 [Tenacibaculum sp. KUL118]|nr:hypothetical protein KUL118_66270 [Tenacibaculum sp. KUL118]